MPDISLDSWLTTLGIENELYRLSVEVFIVILATALLSYLSALFFRHMAKQFEKTSNLWDDNILHAARRPVSLAIWIFGISLAIYTTQDANDSSLFLAIVPVQKTAVIFCFAWFVVRFIKGAESILVSEEKMREPMDETTVSAIGKLLRASIVITAVLVVLQTLGFSISGVLAFGGIGGIAVGFAAKDLLANFFGGLMIYLDRPFKVGDWVRSPDREIEGTVEDIGWRLTTIRTFDKRPLYVPNSTFTNISVQNPSRMSHRRIYETIGIRYDDAGCLDKIVMRVKTMLESHDDIDQNQTMIVNFNAFAPSSLDFFVYTFTKTTNWIRYHDVKQNVLFQILDIIREEGAEVAFPTSTVHLLQAESEESAPKV